MLPSVHSTILTNFSLVINSFAHPVDSGLDKVEIFHTDRGNEFNNKVIDEVLTTFEIKRSLCKKGCPYDNVVAESTFKIIKIEFAYKRIFKSLEELKSSLFDYINWFNNIRIHGSLDYLSPVEYKLSRAREVCSSKAVDEDPLQKPLLY